MEHPFTPFEAIGTQWRITLFQEYDPELEIEIKQLIQQFEKDYSRFIETSYISRVNRERRCSVPDVEFAYLINKGLEYHATTDGIFDFTQGNVLSDRGYDAEYSFKEKEQTAPNTHIEELISFQEKELVLEGTGDLDIGGYGKGYIIDIIAEYLTDHNYPYFMINGGGDIYVSSDNEASVEILLAHPKKATSIIGSLKLKNQAICTSSPHMRTWRTQTGTTFNHIISPLKSNSLDTSYVISDNAMDADMLATTLCIKHDPEYVKHLQTYISFGYSVIEA